MHRFPIHLHLVPEPACKIYMTFSTNLIYVCVCVCVCVCGVCAKNVVTRKMVPITGRARSFLLVFKNKIERRGRQNKNNRPINLLNVVTFSTDFKYTTQS